MWGFLSGGIVLLVGFVLLQRRATSPLLPLRLVLVRARAGAYLALLTIGIGLLAVPLMLTYYLQENLALTPALTGLAFLPLATAIILASTTVPAALLARVGPRPLILGGILAMAGGVAWLALLPASGSYFSHVLPPTVLIGLGLGTAMSTAVNTATIGVETADAGVASALSNTMQQVGAALLSTIAASTTAAVAITGSATDTAAVVGYDTAFAVAAVIFVVGAVAAFTVLPGRETPGPTRPSGYVSGASVLTGPRGAR